MHHVDLIIFYYTKQMKLKLKTVYLNLLVLISFSVYLYENQHL